MLSPAQKVASTEPGHVVIAACPGSGKTTVLKFRAQFLLENDPQARLAAVTFTKEAANSLKERIANQYPSGAKRVEAGTFHSLCITQLKLSGMAPKIVEPGSAVGMIKRAISSCPHADPTLEYDDYVQAIEAWQREVAPAVPPAETSALAYVYREYGKLKRQQGLVDFGDLIRDAVIGMQNGKVKPLAVKYMLADEFQDTDAMQLQWVLEHAKAGVQVTIVGDDDQAIYGFRGSLGYNGMMEFQEKTGATLINLDRTYRCPVQVLKPAALLISNNTARLPKQLATACPTAGEVRVRSFEDRGEEAKAVLEMIKQTGEPEKWGVLARTNAQLDEIDALAAGYEVPVVRKKTESFWGLKGPAHLLSLAKSINNRDMLGVSEMMTLAGLSAGSIDAMAREYDFSRPGSLDRFAGARLTGKNAAFLTDMQRQVTQWREMLSESSHSQLKLAVGGMAQYIAKYGAWKPSEAADITERLRSASQSIASLRGTLTERLRALSKSGKEDGKGAALLTLHASKGLEFEYIWIVGCDLGIVPSIRDGSDVQEERRLLYVGITRSMRFLMLSHTLEKGKSPFLEECGLMGSSFFKSDSEAPVLV